MKKIDYPLQSNNFSTEITEIQSLIAVQTQSEDEAVERLDSVSPTVVAQEVPPLVQLHRQMESVHPISDVPQAKIREHSRKKKPVLLATMLVVLVCGGVLLFLCQERSDENSSIGNDSVIPIQTNSSTMHSEIGSTTMSDTVSDSVIHQTTTTGYVTVPFETTIDTAESSEQTSITTLTTTTTSTAANADLSKTATLQSTTKITSTETAESETTVVDSEITTTSRSDNASDQSSASSNLSDTYQHPKETED